jgi:hypothetical protein
MVCVSTTTDLFSRSALECSIYFDIEKRVDAQPVQPKRKNRVNILNTFFIARALFCFSDLYFVFMDWQKIKKT